MDSLIVVTLKGRNTFDITSEEIDGVRESVFEQIEDQIPVVVVPEGVEVRLESDAQFYSGTMTCGSATMSATFPSGKELLDWFEGNRESVECDNSQET